MDTPIDQVYNVLLGILTVDVVIPSTVKEIWLVI